MNHQFVRKGTYIASYQESNYLLYIYHCSLKKPLSTHLLGVTAISGSIFIEEEFLVGSFMILKVKVSADRPENFFKHFL